MNVVLTVIKSVCRFISLIITDAFNTFNVHDETHLSEKLYYPYHSLDPAQAVERIIEAKGLGEEEYIQRGVELLRELRKKEQLKYSFFL